MANNTSIGVVVGKKNLEDLNKLNTELKKSNELLQAQIKILADVNKQYAGAKNTTQLKAALNKQEQANVTIQKSQKTITEKNTALQKERIRVENQKKTILAKTLALEEKGTKTLIKGQERLKIARKKAREEAQKALGVNKKSNGLFRSMAKSMIAVGVAAIGIRTVFNVFKNSLKTIANFEEAMSKVKAVTGALPKEFKQLSNNAKELGSSTSKTATEVAGLQLEFSKLGFSTQEILNATEATISLSIAAGSDLAESAVVAASTIRGFGLDASEAQRVVDVMAKSFASSALDLEKFKTSMAAVAPVAKANGKDIEFVTSQLSVLSDAGLDASTSGTSLRNMFLNLSKEGLTWEQGLAKINNSTNKNVAALDLFGKRGATAALILADNIKKAEGLEKAYDGAAGAAEEMARIMEDNLIGDTKKLSSAWEGFILGLNKGEGTVSRVFRAIIQDVTDLVNWLKRLNLTEQERQDIIDKDLSDKRFNTFKKSVDESVKSIKNLETAEKKRGEAIEKELIAAQKELDGYITQEKIASETDLERAFHLDNLINQSTLYIEKLEASSAAMSEANKLTDENTEAVDKNAKAIKRHSNLTKISLEDVKKYREASAKVWSDLADQFRETNGILKDSKDELITGLREIPDELQDALDGLEAGDVTLWDKLLATSPETTMAFINQFTNLADTLFDYNQGIKERELESVRANYDARINAAEGNSELQEALTKELAQKQWAIELELAKSEKNQAIISATIATAVATVEALPNIALAALTAAAGVIQIATIQAQPLPEPPAFAKGTKSTPDTFIAGDKPNNNSGNSQELMITKDGKMLLTPNHATLYENMSGTQVIPADQTKQILNTVNMANAGVINTQQMEGKLDEIKEAVVQSESKLSLDKRGIVTLQRGNNAMVTKLNTRI